MIHDATVQPQHLLDAIGGQHVLAGNDDGLEESVRHGGLGGRVLRENAIHPHLILI